MRSLSNQSSFLCQSLPSFAVSLGRGAILISPYGQEYAAMRSADIPNQCAVAAPPI